MKYPALILFLGITATVILTHLPMSVFGSLSQRSFVLFPQVEQVMKHGQVSYQTRGIRVTSNDLAHFGMYGCIGLVAWSVVRPRRRKAHALSLIVLACLAATDEFTQGFFHRQPEFADWLIDCSGILAGWTLSCLVMRPWLLILRHGRKRRFSGVPGGLSARS